MNNDEIATPVANRYRILLALAQAGGHGVTIDELEAITGLPKPSVKRLIRQVAVDFAVEVIYVREAGRRSATGGFSVQDWGVINKDELLSKFGSLLGELPA